MNDHDLNNFEFFLQSDTNTLAKWFNTATPKDYQYVETLMKNANELLIEQIISNEENLIQSKTILSKFMLSA